MVINQFLNHPIRAAIGLTALGFAIAGCSTTLQTTSGADYLARSSSSPNAAALPTYNSNSDLNAEILEIAAIEPDLRFPARIGLARIERSGLTSVPAEEGYIWADVAAEFPDGLGELVPVNPLIAASVSAKTYENGDSYQKRVLAHIRRGAARQHLDYVLIYDAHSKSDAEANGLSFTDLSLLGMFVLPSRNVEVEATASAILMDVRTGYPYATLTHFAEDKSAATANRTRSKRKRLSEQAELTAVSGLAEETRDALIELAIGSAATSQ